MKIYEVWAHVHTSDPWPNNEDYRCVARYMNKATAELHARRVNGSVDEEEVSDA